MPVHQTGYFPALRQELRSARRCGNGVVDVRCKQMTRVVVAVAIIEFDVLGIIGDHGTVFADLIQSVRPGVSECRSQPAPRANSETRLQGVVVGSADAVELEN